MDVFRTLYNKDFKSREIAKRKKSQRNYDMLKKCLKLKPADSNNHKFLGWLNHPNF